MFSKSGLTLALLVPFALSIPDVKENTIPLKDIYSIIENLGPILQSVNIQVSQDDENNTQKSAARNENEQPEDKLQTGTNMVISGSLDTKNETELAEYSQEKVLEDVVNNLQDSVVLKNIKPLDKIQQNVDKEALTDDSEETIILHIQSSPEIQPNRRNIDSKPRSEDRFAKYKQLQQKIGSLLNREKVSDKTKDLISDAFDKVMTQMNEKCTLRAIKDQSPKMNRRLAKYEKAAMKKILKSYKSKFNKLIDKYRKSDVDNDIFGSIENSKFLSKLRELFFEMHNSFQNFTTRHDLDCNVVDVAKHKIKKSNKNKNKPTASPLREKKESTTCKFHKICPYELKTFLTDLSTYIINAIDLVFNNYKKMFIVDVPKESSGERESFLQFMADAKDRVNKKFNETYAKEIDKIDLESNPDINAKVARLNTFIDATVNYVKTVVNDALMDELPKLRNKIQYNVKTDIMTETDIELVNVEEKIKAEMCKSFETCYENSRRRPKHRRRW